MARTLIHLSKNNDDTRPGKTDNRNAMLIKWLTHAWNWIIANQSSYSFMEVVMMSD